MPQTTDDRENDIPSQGRKGGTARAFDAGAVPEPGRASPSSTRMASSLAIVFLALVIMLGLWYLSGRQGARPPQDTLPPQQSSNAVPRNAAPPPGVAASRGQ